MLTVKPLLYAIGALLLLCALLIALLAGSRSHARQLQAQLDVAAANQRATQAEREAWKRQADSLTAAAHGARTGIDTLKAALSEQQQACIAMNDANRRAVESAAAAAARADTALRGFSGRWKSESTKPRCAAALKAMEEACPALRNY